ncbi:glycosyltransferase [Pelagibacterales bacterium SAG-MED02]|nr:glycosyltransferase [Pelagibacterales bacterium SAG-MED02]
MNVGIFLKSRDQKEGGGYTITYDIFEKLINNTNLFKHKLYFVIVGKLSKDTKNLLKINKLNFINISENKFLFKIKNYIFCKFNILLKLYNLLNFNRIENYYKKNKVDFIWPISSELRHPFSFPYFFTIWDLQHKTISEYKEVGSLFTRIYREELIKKNIEFSKLIITGTKVGANEIKKYYGIKKEKIILNSHPTPSWVNVKKTSGQKFLKKIKVKNFFLYPANFWQHKNHLNLLKGFKIFLQNNKEYKLVLVGNIIDKILYRKIKSYIINNKLRKHVKILGYVSRKNLLILYDNCLALTYLSVSGPENLPPLEALARGKHIVYSNFKGAKEQLKNLPIYVNYKNPKSIANGMKNVLNKKKQNFLYKKFSKYQSTIKYINKINIILKKLEKC